MQKYRRVAAGGAGAVGALLVAIGVVYLTVACENLPGILGPHPGETAPRTPRGVAGVALGIGVLVLAVAIARRRPPGSTIGS